MKLNLGIFFKISVLMVFLNPLIGMAKQPAGPLGVRNHFPPHMMFLTPRPHSPQTIASKTFSGALSFDYFSIYSKAYSSDHTILMDMEAMVVDLRLVYGLTDDLSFGMRVPMVSMQDGFMDHPLEWYHHSLGLPNYGKEKRPKDEFAYMIEKDHQRWFQSKKGGLNLLDSTIFTQINLIDHEKKIPTKIDLTYEVKLPIGDETFGFGSGACDYGFFIPIQFRLSRINTYLMPGYIRIGKPQSNNADISVRDIKSFFLGGEYPFTSNVSFVAQINAYTSPFGTTGIERLDNASVELALGLKWALTSQINAEMAFCEDLTRSAPDFNLHFMMCLTI
jgi:hypothetical protein